MNISLFVSMTAALMYRLIRQRKVTIHGPTFVLRNCGKRELREAAQRNHNCMEKKNVVLRVIKEDRDKC
jgi:hypothetical protein